MTKILRANLRTLTRKQNISADVQDRWDSLVIEVNLSATEDIAMTHRHMVQILSHTPGIGYALEIDEHPFESLDQAYQLVREANRDVLEGKTFCVRVKRAGNHDFTSHDAEIYMGGGLLKETGAIGVSLKNPDVVVHAELRNDKVQVVKRRIPGLGGFPLGSQGDVLSLISGGFDSTVASYLLTRRGLKTHFCFFNLGGSAHEIGVKQVAHYLWSCYGESHRVKFVTIPFEEVVAEILTKVDNGHMGVVLKRMMMRAASQVADNLKLHALATGEAVAQVSSQTISNLAIIDRAAEHMVLRPLAAMDKQDIITIARRIGTETFAANMPEYCGVISVNPLTHGERSKTEAAEQAFDFTVLERALQRSSYQRIDRVLEETGSGLEDVALLTTPALSDEIIDIRHPDEAADAPLELANNPVRHIPFYELESRLRELDTSGQQRYLLYCHKGTMSKVHAHHVNQTHPGLFGVFMEKR